MEAGSPATNDPRDPGGDNPTAVVDAPGGPSPRSVVQEEVSARESDAQAESGEPAREGLKPSRVAGRDFGRADTAALIARLPEELRRIHARIEEEFPGRDLTEVQELAQTLLDKRRQFPDVLGDADREAMHAWIVQAETLSNALVEQRAAELGLARGGVENDRGFWLAGFQDGKPAYTWTMNAAAAESTGANLVRLVPSYDLQLASPADGTGIYVNVNDHGTIYEENPEFQLPSNGGTRILYKEIYDEGARDHMTHCSGTVGAWGYNPSLMGMAPRVWIRAHIQQYSGDITQHGMAWPGQKHTTTNPRTGETEMKSVMGTTSLGYDYTGAYDSSAAFFDSTLRDYPYYIHFYAASNSGSAFNTISAGHAMAKNLLTIGSVTDTVRDDAGNYTSGGNISGFSSRGPTLDGRIKPELTANGDALLSPSSATGSSTKSGTSMATPNASGSATLLIDYIQKKLPGHFFRSSTLKALLINTATDRGNAGPDYTYGYGIVNVKAAADIVKRYAENPSSRVVHEDDLAPNQVWTETYTYDGSGPIRVTLAWIDPAGAAQLDTSTDRSPRLVNNLNLRLISPGGTTYYPYVMPFTTGNGTYPAYDSNLYAAVAVTGDNFTDNVEQVYIAAPPAGTYTLQVTHAGTLQNNTPQPFSLAVSGMSAAVPVHTVTSVSPNIGDASDNFILKVGGTQFGLGYDVILRRVGSSDVEAYGEMILQDQITCRVDTAALAKGYWDVVVRAPGGTEAVLPNAFLLPVSGGSGSREIIYANTFENGAAGLTLGTGWSLADPNKSAVSGPADPQQGAFALVTYAGGNYPGNSTSYATFPAISTVGYTGIRIEFQRWLGLAKQGNSTDYGRVQYSTDGTNWVTHTTHSNLNETAWALRTYDLPVAAEGKSTLFVRFSLETDANNHSYGWNIDDFKITGIFTVVLPPVFTSTPPASGTQGQPFSYTATVTDADTPSSGLSFSATGLPPGLTLTNNGNASATLSGTPTVSGLFAVTLTVTDGAYSTYQIFNLPILPAGGNTPPVITTNTLPDAFVGQPYAGTVAATDADAHSLILSIGTKPSWLTFTDNGNGTATLGGTPPSGFTGTYNLVVSAFDGYQTTSKTLTLTVRPRAEIGFSSASIVVGEANSSVLLTVRRTLENFGPVSVAYASANGTATAGADYSAVSGTLTWADGDMTDKTISVPILNDTLSEVDETFTVTLSGLTGVASLGIATVTVTIDDDENNALVYVQVTDADCAEANSDDGVFTLYRTGDTAAAMTVNYTLSGTATNGVDYQSRTGIATFSAGSASTTVVIDPIDDNIYEGDETVILTIEPGVTYNIGEPASAQILLVENDKPTVSIAASSTLVGEDAGSVTLTFTRTGTTALGPLTVFYTVSGTAAMDADYGGLPSSVTIPLFQSSTTLTIPIFNDNLIEPPETLSVTLSTNAAYNTAASPNQAVTVTIRDDTEPIVLVMSAADGSASEPGKGDGGGTFRITRWGNPAPGFTVNLTPPTGSATSGVDYQTLPSSVTMPGGATTVDIPLTVIDDTIPEPDEVLTLGIAGGAGYTVSNTVTANINLYDDEDVQIRLEVSDGKCLEAATPDNGTFVLRRLGRRTDAVTVTFSISGTATNGTDYTAISNSITIGANSGSASLSIVPINDSLVEGSESVTLTLTSVSVGTIAAAPDNSATLWIRDDETVDVTVSVQDGVCMEGPTPDPGSFRITRSATAATPLTVNYTVSGTATNGTDFMELTGTATIPANATTVDVSVLPINDALVEGPESVILTLALNGAAYDIGDANSATLWIRDDEVLTITLTAPDAAAAEPEGGITDNGQWLFTASAAPASPLTLRYSVSGGANGMDYLYLPGTLVLPAGQTSVTLDLIPFDDELVEGAETITLTLLNDPAYNSGNTSGVPVVIAASDTPTIRVYAARPAAAENPTVAGQFRFESDKIFTGNTNLLYFMSGTATNGTDYDNLPGTLVISANNNTIALTLTPTDDADSEGLETAILTITDSASYVVAPGGRTATITIADDEADGSRNLLVSPLALTVAEGGSAAFSVALDTVPAANLTVSVARVSGDADLTVQSGASLTFTPGNWSTPQLVTLSAAPDGDSLAGTATFSVSAAGHPTVFVTATEADAEAPPVITLVSPEISPLALPDLGVSLELIATATDTIGTPSIAWTQVSGPATAVFANASVGATSVRFPSPGTYVLRATATDHQAQTASVEVTIFAGASGAAFTATTLGTTNYPGAFSVGQGTITIIGTGGDISGPAESGYYLTTPLSGDFSITARVASLSAVETGYTLNSAAKAGIIARETTTPGSPLAFEGMSADNNSRFIYRATPNVATSASNTSGLAIPYFIRLDRVGNSLRAYRSADGVTWTQQGSSQTITMTNPVQVGFAVASGNINASQPVAVFDRITGLPATNGAPQINLGPAPSATAGAPAPLVGSVTDDDLPAGSELSLVWTLRSGPAGATVVFADVNAPSTTATFSAAGTYVLRLTASDGPSTVFEELTVAVAGSALPATVSLSNLNHTYDGTAKAATVTTTPAGLAVSVTYNGSATAPIPAGSYTVQATVTEPGYEGSASGTLVIAKATPTVSVWPTASELTYGQTLGSAVLTGGSASVAGTFSFANPGTLPPPGTSSHSVLFTPNDSANHNNVNGSVPVTVSNLVSNGLVVTGGTSVGMSVSSSPALRYRLRYKNSLLDPEWMDFTPIQWTNGTGSVIELADPTGIAPIRFYILVAEPKP